MTGPTRPPPGPAEPSAVGDASPTRTRTAHADADPRPQSPIPTGQETANTTPGPAHDGADAPHPQAVPDSPEDLRPYAHDGADAVYDDPLVFQKEDKLAPPNANFKAAPPPPSGAPPDLRALHRALIRAVDMAALRAPLSTTRNRTAPGQPPPLQKKPRLLQ